MIRVRQNFVETPALDLPAVLRAELARIRGRIRPGARIAVGVGSRGITHLRAIVAATIEELRAFGAEPFLLPAMGSHGGATPEGQREVLASYGITEATMGVPIRAAMEVRQVGVSRDGVAAFCSVEALAADGILVINRVKPHTDFSGLLGSGLIKMVVIGLGKRIGAVAMHEAASRIGHEQSIRGIAEVLIPAVPLLGGVAILENQFHETARLVVVPREEMLTAETALLAEARALMPLLPLDEVDLLVVDRIGKNISGAGMDPNVINRSVQGYSSSLMREGRPAPFIRRIVVRSLTSETHGNANGIGLADFTTTRLQRETDANITNINALTALAPQAAKLPVVFDTDREVIDRALASLALADPSQARVVRIADTLSLSEMEFSSALWSEVRHRPEFTSLGEEHDMVFSPDGALLPDVIS